MKNVKQCPKCKISWQEEITITETFLGQGKSPTEAARLGKNYGCTPSTPQHFSRNVVGVEVSSQYDGISYWKCGGCKTYFDRWSMKPVDPKWEVGI